MKKVYIALIALSAMMLGVFGTLFVKDAFFPNPSAATADSASGGNEGDKVVVEQGKSALLTLSEQEEKDLVHWQSADNAVAFVDSGGRIDALGQGETDVTASFSNGKAVTYHVTVTAPQPQPRIERFTTAITANRELAEKNYQNKAKKLPFEIQVNRKQNCVTVFTYDDKGDYTVPVRAMVCSCGVENKTELGEFTIYYHTKWQGLVNDVFGMYASSFHGDLLFHSVPYTDLTEDTLKADEFNKLGDFASRGCVRMAVEDCKWICDYCPDDTVVKIFDSDEALPLGRPETIKIADTTIGWDPTDRHPDNPYRTKTPVISGAYNLTLQKGVEYNMTDGITAVDTCGNDVTSKIETTGNVNPNRAGVYRVTYTVTDALHRSAREDITVTVEETK